MTDATAPPKAGLIDQIGLRWFFRLLSSSIGQKFVLGLTGLLLCGFVATHLAGNLLLFVGKDAFNNYAHALHNQHELLLMAEVGLLVLFLAHVYLAVSTSVGNTRARTEQYSLKTSKIPGRVIGASSWMFVSGAIVLGFVILHLIDMKFQLHPGLTYNRELPESAPYENTLLVLGNPVSRVVYFIGVVVLGVHLSHGFASAFQSIGWNHPKYMPLIKLIGRIFAVVIAVGFAAIVVFVPGLQR